MICAMARRVRVLYTGDVQGVGFRRRAVDVAHGFEATGFVRNLEDGRVELVAEGDRDELDRLLAAVRDRMAGLVRDEETQWTDATGEFADFAIRR
jgi:acylphosphatase